MKNLKVKSILFSLLAVMVVAVFMTSCEQAATTFEDDITEMSIENDEAVVLIEDLSDTEDGLESRGCQRKVRGLSYNKVSWTSSPQYALWIRHYDSNDNYISTQRMDVPYCGTWTKVYSVPPGRCRTEVFVGYKHWGTKVFSCC